MKKNRNSIASRMLRLENLESREMLSVAPAGLAAASMFLDAGNVVDEPIDLGLSDVDEEASASTFIVSDYDEGTRVATVSWDAFEGAESYAVQISRDGGETWLEYSSDLVETSEEITGITVGKSYAFQAIGFDAEGAVVAERQVSFAPISMSCSNDAFMFGETITVEVAGAENATYDINWYYVVDGENVEITQAFNDLSFKPTEGKDVVVVATGTGDSTGSSSTARVPYVVEHASTVVTSLADTVNANDGLTTLREAVAYAQDGDTITFDESLAGGTIRLNGEYIEIKSSVAIDASTVGGITIDAGGASRIFKSTAENLSLDSLALLNGHAESNGGALWLDSGSTVSILHCTVSNNTAEYHGGAIYVGGGMTVSVVDTEITDNVSKTYGSAICVYSSELILNGATIANNTSERSQGALFFNADASGAAYNAAIYNSIVAANVGGDVFVGGLAGPIEGYAVLTNFTGWTNEDAYVIDYDAELPLFFDAENSDYSLAADSQARDVGVNEYVTTEVDLAGNPRIDLGFVDLGAYEYTETPIRFAYDSSNYAATLDWDPLRDSEKYELRVSYDNGETWGVYAQNIEGTEADVNGIYYGNSYLFRVYGVQEDGTLTRFYRETLFAPATITVAPVVYGLGDTITVNVVGSADAAVETRWYAVTPDGDVEIEGTAGLLEYTPTTDDYDIRVVATGIDASEGSFAEKFVATLASEVGVAYDATTRVATLTWNAIDNIETYKVRISRDGGETWFDYANGCVDLTCNVNGLWAGREISFRIYGETESGLTEAYRAKTFAPIDIVPAPGSFLSGENIVVSLKGAESAAADISWYYITGAGDVEIEGTAGAFEFTPTDDAYDIKVVARGTGISEGAVATRIIPSRAEKMTYVYDSTTNKAALVWRPIVEADSYLVKISRDGGETWLTYRTGLNDTAATVNGVYPGTSYLFRAYAVDENGAVTSTYHESAELAPARITAGEYVYQSGDTISLTVVGTANSELDVRWYAITEEGDVEIEEAAGLTEYAPESDAYDLRVVATGIGVSAGSYSTAVIATLASDVSVVYDSAALVGTLGWEAIDGVETYKVRISRDGGETWLDYANGANLTCDVKHIQVGREYSFRIYGETENGITRAYRERTFAPINVVADRAVYDAGDTITLTLQGAESATVDVNWYFVTSRGDVEIEEAAGMLEYVSTTNDYDIKVVATGVGVSEGSNATVLVASAAPQLKVTYSSETRQAQLEWRPLGDAESYLVEISRDNGETWTVYRRGLEEREATVNNLYPREYSYLFRVYGVDADGGRTPEYHESEALSPARVVVDAVVYNVGDTITATVYGAENAEVDVRWYTITSEGDVEIEEAAGLLEYTPTSDVGDIRVVAVGVGASEGSYSEAVVATLASKVDVVYDSETNVGTLKWDAIDAYETYKVRISRDGGVTWEDYANGCVNETCDVAGLYVGSEYSFRVYGEVGGTIASPYRETTFAPVGVAASATNYVAGDTIVASVVGADSASAELVWTYFDGTEYVEIEEARGLPSYTPTDDLYDLTVFAVGNGVSEGSMGRLTIKSDGAPTRMVYNSETRVGTLMWRPIEGASVYRVQICRPHVDGNWYKYAKNITETSLEINGLYESRSYGFRIIGYADVDDGTEVEGRYELTFAPGSEVDGDAESILDEAFASYFDSEL